MNLHEKEFSNLEEALEMYSEYESLVNHALEAFLNWNIEANDV